MPWNKVEEVEPPKDRVIEVTSGGAWVYEDRYYAPDTRRRPNTTHRVWKFQGGVTLVLWHEGDGLIPAYKDGAWIETLSGSIMPGFKFWREYENPIAGLEGYITDTTPPHPIYQDFEGDARLRIYDQLEASVTKDIAWANKVIEDDVSRGRMGNPSTVRALGLYEARLLKIQADRANAFDPYDLPPNVRGTNKSD